MKNFSNRLIGILFILFISSISNAQQLNRVRAYMAPAEPQTSYFPSEQQVQAALAPHTAIMEEVSGFPPLEPQAFINQFSTPDAQRTTAMSQFVAPDLMMDGMATSQQEIRPKRNDYGLPAVKYPRMPRSMRRANNRFMAQRFVNSSMGGLLPNNFVIGNNGNPFPLPQAFPMMPFTDINGLPPIIEKSQYWNKMGDNFPLRPKKKRHNVLPDFYTNPNNYPMNKAWGKTMNLPQTLEGGANSWRNISDPATLDTGDNQFPPIKKRDNLANWNIF